jgi:Arc/MetJ family transcription regulator
MPVGKMSMRPVRYTRKSFFVDAQAIARARKALGTETDAETVRLAVERVVEMERFWRFMTGSRGSLKPGSFEAP